MGQGYIHKGKKFSPFYEGVGYMYIPAVLHYEHTLVVGVWLVQAVSEVQCGPIPTCFTTFGIKLP